jgi:hypothetical protein
VEGSRLTDDWVDREGTKKYSDFLKAYIIVEIPDPFEAMEAAKPVQQASPESSHPAAGREPDDDIPF